MNQTERNIAIISDIYAAFGRGDVPYILERVAPEVIWDYQSREYGIPWLKQGSGRAFVAEFFQVVAGLDFERFQVRAITGAGPLVISVVDVAFTVKASGRRVEDPWEAHYFELDEHGRIAKMRHIVDTLAHRAAA